MKLVQLYSTVGVLCSQLCIGLRLRPSTRLFSHEIFFFNQSTACLSSSADYSQGISKPFPVPLFTLFPVILQLILLFGNQRNMDIHRLKHFGTWPTRNPSFTTATVFLSSTFCDSFLHTRYSSVTGVHIFGTHENHQHKSWKCNFLSFCQPFFYWLRTALPQFVKLTFMWWVSNDFSTMNSNKLSNFGRLSWHILLLL